MRISRTSILLFVFAGMALLARDPAGASNAFQSPQEVRELRPGTPIEREIVGGEIHTYRITLAARQFVRIAVSQREVDVTVRVFGPEGQSLLEVDKRSITSLGDRVSLVTEAMGHHTLEVRAPKKDAAPGRYQMKIEELRAATTEDSSRVAAERSFVEGEQLRVQRKAGTLPGALAKYEKALSQYRSAGDGQGQAYTLTGIGKVYIRMGQSQKALGSLIEALSLTQSMNDSYVESQIYISLGGVYSNLGEPLKSMDAYNRALKLFRERGERVNELIALDSIGLVHSEMGEYQQALNYHNQVLTLIRAGGQREAEASAASRYIEVSLLHNIGYAYASLGDYQEALEYMGKVLELNRAAKYPYGEAYALHNIGWVHALSGELQEALVYLGQSVVISRTIENQELQAGTLGMMGVVYSDLNQPQKALELLSQALTLNKTLGIHREEVTTLNQIGSVYAKMGDRQNALESFTRALSLSRAIGLRPDEAAALGGLAEAYCDSGDLNEARAKIVAALDIIESVRTGVTSQQLRTSYLASNKSYYELYIDVLMRLDESSPSAGHNSAALEASERSRARSLLESLIEARADIRQGVDPALLERERLLQQQLNAKAARLTQLLSSQDSPGQAEGARKEVDALISRYQELQAQIRATSPRYAALTQPAPVSLKEIQQQLLDDDTLMLEYALGKERSFLWVVTTGSITNFVLPGRTEIESAAERAYKLLTMSHTRQRKRESELALAALGRMLLEPVADQLEKKRLLIVADGALQYIPFAALPAPKIERRRDREKEGQREGGAKNKKLRPSVSPSHRLTVSPTPLIVNHEIVSLPSASVLAVLRQELANRKPASNLLAVLADPVLGSDDSRVKQTKIKPEKETSKQVVHGGDEQTKASDLIRSARESGVTSLDRLVFTRREAEEILTLARDGKNLKALDFDASRATAMSPELAQYRIVHFATHGLLNSQHPELSGLVLSLVDEAGRPQDGFLRMHDVYNLKLGVDLVVLSACQTALGKQIKGEGFVGLVRGFMYAGAPRVVASLWDVKDEATAELMKRFYQGMLKEGLRPAAALRAAQVSLRKEPRWEAPYYWAGFVLQGEWK